jgi:hypothetical protein
MSFKLWSELVQSLSSGSIDITSDFEIVFEMSDWSRFGSCMNVTMVESHLDVAVL